MTAGHRAVIEAVVLGRVGVDLTPPELRTSLAAASAFIRAVGGFAGNVGTGLARLGHADRASCRASATTATA